MFSGKLSALGAGILKDGKWGRGSFNSIAALLSLLLVISAYVGFPNLHVFGHDEVHYNTYYKLKLLQDGRWLNYLLRDFLASVDVSAWFLIYIASHLLLIYRLSRLAGASVAISFLVSAVVTISPPVVEQSLWPATAFPAIAILIAAEVFVRKGIAPWVVYMVLGVLLFGSMQNYYFLVPLLFLRQFLSDSVSGKLAWMLVARHMGMWVLGAVLGTLVMSFALLLLAGHFGPEVGAWRQPQPVKDLASLLHNILYVSNSWLSSLKAIYVASRVGGVILGMVVVAFLGVFVWKFKRGIQLFFLLLMVAFAFHAFSIPLAPIITMRSLIAMVAAVVFSLALLARSGRLASMAISVLLLFGGVGFQLESRSFFNKQADSVGFVFTKIGQILPMPAANYSTILIDGRMQAGSAVADVFNNSYLMASVVKALGARNYLDCRSAAADKCLVSVGRSVDSSISVDTGRLDFYALDKGRALIIYSEE